MYLANAIMSLQQEINRGREYLAAQQALVEERKAAAISGSGIESAMDVDGDVPSPTSVAAATSDKAATAAPTPSSMALEDPISVYK